jgi:signal transduction histidine kinase
MIIDKLHGKIGFVSTPGEGTTFHFDLDADAQAERESTERGSATRAA